MTGTALILGSTGRFGQAAATAFKAAGWAVTEWRRPDPAAFDEDGIVRGDLFDSEALAKAAMVDVIVNGLNPAYPDWTTEVPRITAAVIGAAKASGATVLIPGNIYNYGAGLPPLLTASTPEIGDHKKAVIRIAMEAAYRDAGVPTIILRAGDFIDTAPGDNWFEGQITAKAAKGQLMYPGPTDAPHAWAFLPDMARAAEMLAARRADLPCFTAIGFPGYTLTGAELMDLVDQATGGKAKRSNLPWTVVRLMGLFNPIMRELVEMRYLWQRPHAVDGSDFEAALPDFRATDPADAIRASLTGSGALCATPLAPPKRSAITA